MERLEKEKIVVMAYGLLIIITALPLACEYVMQGGNIMLWLHRIEEMVNANEFLLFPSAEVMTMFDERVSTVNSNLLLYVPVFLRKMGLSITTAYRLYMLLIQIVTVLGARAFFDSIFQEKITSFIGVLLFITCPYRVYICYDTANLGLAAAWALTVVYAWAVSKMCQNSKNWKIYAVAILTAAGIASADVILFVMVIGLSAVCFLISGKVSILFSVMGGCVLSMPVLMYVLRYLVLGNLELYHLPLESITMRGYTPGQILSSFAYASDRPGLGIALFGASALLGYMLFIGEISLKKTSLRWMVDGAALMLFLTTVYFPWDFIQRVAAIFHRFVSLIGSPNIFMGIGCFLLSIPSAYAVGHLKFQENKFLRYGMSVIIVIAAVGASIWHCNTLTYTRQPMFLIDTLQ